MLVKSTPGVNFINVLRAAFARVHVSPKSAKIHTFSLNSYAFGICREKAVRKHVCEIDPRIPYRWQCTLIRYL